MLGLKIIHVSKRSPCNPGIDMTGHRHRCFWVPWWRHQMEIFSALLALCAGNSPVPVNSPHKGQWRGTLMFPLICVWINGWINNREAGDLRRYRAHSDVIVMTIPSLKKHFWLVFFLFYHFIGFLSFLLSLSSLMSSNLSVVFICVNS